MGRVLEERRGEKWRGEERRGQERGGEERGGEGRGRMGRGVMRFRSSIGGKHWQQASAAALAVHNSINILIASRILPTDAG